MDLKKYLYKKSMRQKLILITAITLVIGLGITSYFSMTYNVSKLKESSKNEIDLLSSTLTTGIKSAMVTGNALIVTGWIDRIKEEKLLVDIEVIRKNGVIAFSDSATEKLVNEFMGSDEFELRKDPENEIYSTLNREALKGAVELRNRVSFEETIDGESVQTILIPLEKEEACYNCHGYDKNPIQGVLKFSISQEAMLDAIKTNILRSIISSLILIILIAFIMNFLIHRLIIKPTALVIHQASQAGTQQVETSSQQAASTHEITTTIEELSASSKQVNQKAESLAEQANSSLEVSYEGQKAIEDSIVEMNMIKSNVEAIAEDVLGLSETTNQIGNIISVVSDIAKKTDMLALNAAIEAAKAGEQGKGFAVVASEVRSLADQSKKATEKITELIQQIQTAVNSTVMTTEEGGKKVDAGVQHIRSAGSTINNAIEIIRMTADASNEIAIASRQETDATNQVAEAMTFINNGMQETSASTK